MVPTSGRLLLLGLFGSLLQSGVAAPTGSAAPAPTGSGAGDLPPNSSGSLRGDESLLGNNHAPANPSVTDGLVPQYTTVPGQSESAKLGLFLDFSNVDEPQPIRGTGGGTDPGPREHPNFPFCCAHWLIN